LGWPGPRKPLKNVPCAPPQCSRTIVVAKFDQQRRAFNQASRIR